MYVNLKKGLAILKIGNGYIVIKEVTYEDLEVGDKFVYMKNGILVHPMDVSITNNKGVRFAKVIWVYSGEQYFNVNYIETFTEVKSIGRWMIHSNR
mgnify:CR=1 FL=1